MGAPKKLPGFVRRKRPYRTTIHPRKVVALYKTTYDDLKELKRPDETWDEFIARISGVKRRRT